MSRSSRARTARSRNGGFGEPAVVDGTTQILTGLPPAPVRELAPPVLEKKHGRAERLRQFWFGTTDLAPLGLFRIVYGVLLFAWIWQLLPNLSPFFTDAGMLPRHSLLTFHPLRFTLLNAIGEWWQVFLFWLAGLTVAVLLIVGYRTRTACFLAFVVTVSFQWRNPLILDGSDLVFRLIPFWMLFTAVGDRYSVDAAIRRVRGNAPSGFGPALPVRILELQVAWIYFATGLEKFSGAKWLDGTATYYALQLKHTFGRAHAEALALNPFVQRISTWGTLAIELLFLPLVFSPLRYWPARLVAIVAIAMLHVGIIAFMNVGNFPFIMLAALLLFLPPDLTYRLVDQGRRLLPRSRVRLFYDGTCHYCRRTAAFLSALDIYRTITLIDSRAVNPAEPGLGRLMLHKQLYVVDERGRVTAGLSAVARASRAVPLLALPAALLRLPGLEWAADRAHQWLSRRGLLTLNCPGGDCRLHPSQAPALRPALAARFRWQRPAVHALVAVVALAALATALPQARAASLPPEPVRRLLVFASLDQFWGMFAPEPAGADGWLLGPGRLADGTEIDVITGGPPSEEPRYASPLYSRWVKVTERISNKQYAGYRLEYGRMYCRLRNWQLKPGQSPLQSFDLYYVQRIIPPPGQGEPILRKHHLWSHTC